MFIEVGLVTERNTAPNTRETNTLLRFSMSYQITFHREFRSTLILFKHFEMCFSVSDQICLVYES